MTKIKFKVLSFDGFISESLSGLKSAKDKKNKAASRAGDLEGRSEKNQAKYVFYDDKEKYEKKHLKLQNDIKAEDDKVQKEKLRAELNNLKKEWKTEQAKYKSAIKAM